MNDVGILGYGFYLPESRMSAADIVAATVAGTAVAVAVVGYAAAGLLGGVLASVVAFSPSFLFILLGAKHFDRIRGNGYARAFLDGAGPAAIGAILGSAVPLAMSISQTWQYVVLACAVVAVFSRLNVVVTLLLAAVAGVLAATFGMPLPS